MTKVLIIEDEQLAADRLIRMLGEIDPGLEIIEHLDSVKTSIEWFKNNSEPQLLFLDIQLSDGLSFEIYDEVPIECPVIFTTAYDQYALQAFKTNSVDYLLKPIVREDLEAALEKFRNRQLPGLLNPSALMDLLQQGKKYKERFVVKLGEHLKSINTSEVNLFYSENKATYLTTTEGKKYLLDYSLSEIEHLLDPEQFFRINRAAIVHRTGISDIISYSNSRLKVIIEKADMNDLVVARDRVNDFKAWLE